jgi:hypothetical protein
MVGTWRCDRCQQRTISLTGSFFNTQMICRACSLEEQRAPNYFLARGVEHAHFGYLDFHYPGVGLKPVDEQFLAACRTARLSEDHLTRDQRHLLHVRWSLEEAGRKLLEDETWKSDLHTALEASNGYFSQTEAALLEQLSSMTVYRRGSSWIRECDAVTMVIEDRIYGEVLRKDALVVFAYTVGGWIDFVASPFPEKSEERELFAVLTRRKGQRWDRAVLCPAQKRRTCLE